MKRAVIITFGLILLWGFSYHRAQRSSLVQTQGQAMGCEWTLLCRGTDRPPEELQREIQGVLERWEQVMSTWRADSDLMRYNRDEPASADLQRVLDLAEKMCIATDGAFDPNVLEAVHRAGFAPAGKGCDLSAIGKGFAVDRVAESLRAMGVNDFLFQLAGETIAGNQAWQVGIEAPDPSGSHLTKTITLKNRALATSGNYRQFESTERGIVSHIIDPRTGEPVIRAFSAVSVIADDCASADVWATALFVSGKREAPVPLEVWWQE
jgi:FAD:protein FMN transferase